LINGPDSAFDASRALGGAVIKGNEKVEDFVTPMQASVDDLNDQTDIIEDASMAKVASSKKPSRSRKIIPANSANTAMKEFLMRASFQVTELNHDEPRLVGSDMHDSMSRLVKPKKAIVK